MDKGLFLNVLSGLMLPALQAAVTAFLIGGIAAALAGLLQVPRWWLWGLLLGLLAGAIYWVSFAARWQNCVFAPPIVRAAHQVIEHKPTRALPEHTERTLRLTVVQDQGRRADILRLPVSDAQMAALAAGLAAGQPFSLGTWTGQGKPFSRAEFEGLRAALVERGVLRLRNKRAPAQGYELSPMGRALMRRYADAPPLPPGDQENA
jgi:hypothetical protein